MLPQQGDKIMIFKDKWLRLILDGVKKLEVRSCRYKEGNYWVGCKGMIRGKIALGRPLQIKDVVTWVGLRDRHRIETNELPYKTTWCFEILDAEAVSPVAFKHPRGAISIVKYRPK
jgi:hypothetical protein